MSEKFDYDFSGYIIKYGVPSINGKIYKKDALKDTGDIAVPLLWNHIHSDPTAVLGHAYLEHREDGVYAYCKLANTNNHDITEYVMDSIHDKAISFSMYVNRVKIYGDYITHGVIREVSLVRVRVDPDEAYIPVMKGD